MILSKEPGGIHFPGKGHDSVIVSCDFITGIVTTEKEQP